MYDSGEDLDEVMGPGGMDMRDIFAQMFAGGGFPAGMGGMGGGGRRGGGGGGGGFPFGGGFHGHSHFGGGFDNDDD